MDNNEVNGTVQTGVNFAFGFVKTTTAATDPAWQLYQQGKSVGIIWSSAYDIATGNNEEKTQGVMDLVSEHPIAGPVIGRLGQMNTLINGTSDERAETTGSMTGEAFFERQILSTQSLTKPKGIGNKTFLDARKSVAGLVEKAKGMTQTQIGAFYLKALQT